MTPQVWGYCLARSLYRHIFRQDAVFHKTDHTVLGILIKFPWHVPDFPIYSNGTKPGALQSAETGVQSESEISLYGENPP